MHQKFRQYFSSTAAIGAVVFCSHVQAIVPATEPERFLEVEESASRPIAELAKLAHLAQTLCEDKEQFYRGQSPYLIPKNLERVGSRAKRIADILAEKYGAQPGDLVFLQDQPTTPFGLGGIRKGDRWVLVVDAVNADQGETSDSPEQAQESKQEENPTRKSRKVLRFKRGAEDVPAKIQAIRTCPASIQMVDSKYLYTEAEYARILITRPLLDALDNEELFIVLAHEYAHLVLGHAQKRSKQWAASILLPRIGQNVETERHAFVEAELIEADRLALWFLVKSGIDPRKFEAVLQKLDSKSESFGRPDYTRTRPLFPLRMEKLKAAIDEWEKAKTLPPVGAIERAKLAAMKGAEGSK